MPVSVPSNEVLAGMPLDELRALRSKLNDILSPQAKKRLTPAEKGPLYDDLIRVECACREALDEQFHKHRTVRRVVYK